MNNHYYDAPNDEAFDELKACAIEVWQTKDNTHGYVNEKVGKIKDLKNVGDNFMYMVAMFDIGNQILLAQKLSEDTKHEVFTRLVAGGDVYTFMYFA